MEFLGISGFFFFVFFFKPAGTNFYCWHSLRVTAQFLTIARGMGKLLIKEFSWPLDTIPLLVVGLRDWSGTVPLPGLLQAPCQDAQILALQGAVMLVVFSVCSAIAPFLFCLLLPQLKNAAFFVLACGSDVSEQQGEDNPTPIGMQTFLLNQSAGPTLHSEGSSFYPGRPYWQRDR